MGGGSGRDSEPSGRETWVKVVTIILSKEVSYAYSTSGPDRPARNRTLYGVLGDRRLVLGDTNRGEERDDGTGQNTLGDHGEILQLFVGVRWRFGIQDRRCFVVWRGHGPCLSPNR